MFRTSSVTRYNKTLYTVLLVASQLSRSRSIRSWSLPAPDSYLISLLPRHAWLRHQPDRSHTLMLITRLMRIAVADDGRGRGRGRGDKGRGGRKDTAWLGFGGRAVLLGVAKMSKSGGLIVAAIVVVVVHRQQRLTVSVRGGNAIAPQALLTLLERRSATPKDIPAAALLTAVSRDTAYIYQARDSSVDVSIISVRG